MNDALHFNPDGTLKETETLDHFAFFDLPRTLKLDEAQLEADYFALSRRFHPDFFVTKSSEQQMLSLEKTSALNNAYRVLRDPISRAEYLVELETGVAFGESGEARQVPTELLVEVMEIRERLMEYHGGSVEERIALRPQIEADRDWARTQQEETDVALASIADKWDETSAASEYAEHRALLIAELKDLLSQRRYFSGLVSPVDSSDEGSTTGRF
jgi:molecular chaperone HscB